MHQVEQSQSMSIGILSLPEELLDAILGCLLPLLKPHLQLDHNIYYQTPKDLLRCRLTCRTLYRVASPWLCRRFDLLETYSSSVDYFEQTRRRLLAKVTFFSTHEDNAGAVRLFHLDRRHLPEFRQVFVPLVMAQPRFFCHMNNLQVLVLKYCNLSDICGGDVFAQLLKQPHLRTIVLEGVDGIDWSYVKDPLFNLKKMDMGYITNTNCLLSLAPRLETLSLRGSALADAHEITSMPWETLSQLRIDSPTWGSSKVVLDDYEAFLQGTGRLSTPLVELAMTRCSDIKRLATMFKCQPLHTLILCDVADIGISLFEHIVTSFPHLREFVLLPKDYIQPWAGDVEEYIAILARLSKLRTFTWNNTKRCNVFRQDTPEIVLRAQLDSMITVIGKVCPRLTSLKFLARDTEVAVVAHIVRDEKWQYKYHELKATFDDSRPSTSAWYVQHYESII